MSRNFPAWFKFGIIFALPPTLFVLSMIGDEIRGCHPHWSSMCGTAVVIVTQLLVPAVFIELLTPFQMVLDKLDESLSQTTNYLVFAFFYLALVATFYFLIGAIVGKLLSLVPLRSPKFFSSKPLFYFIILLIFFVGYNLSVSPLYVHIIPSISTKFASEFSKSKFEAVKPGMEIPKLIELIGEPLEKGILHDRDGKEKEIFSYSRCRGLPLLRLVSINYEVIVYQGKVDSKEITYSSSCHY